MVETNGSRREFLQAIGLYASAAAFTGCQNQKPVSCFDDPKDRPNILWITCEDLSPYIGCYGDPLARTPNLDQFARDGVLYTNAYASAPVCAPARSCLITGVYATSLGTQHLRSNIKLPEKIRCFTEYLRQAGYYCTNNVKKDYNFQDVNAWDESSKTAHWRKCKPGQPFFSVFNFMTTHQGQINGTDEEFFQKYRSKLAPEERCDPTRIKLPPYYPDSPQIRNIWARYYDLITLMDKQTGEILQQLQDDGLADNTIVFFYSDHGSGIPRYKRSLYDSGLKVIFMVRFPKKYQPCAPGKSGSRTDRLVSFVDFAPTVLSLAGLPIPDTMQGTAFMGPQSGKPRKYIYAHASRVDEAFELSRCVRDKRYKYIRNYMPHLPYVQDSFYPDQAEIMVELRRIVAEGKLKESEKFFSLATKPIEEFFDTQNDPHELNNLIDSPKHQKTIQRLRRELHHWILESYDTGFLPEAEMHIRSTGSTPYETVRNPLKYRLSRIVAAADLVGRGPEKISEMKAGLQDADSAVRYWSALALGALDTQAAPATEVLEKALIDSSPNVRIAAAGALCKLDRGEKALPVLAQGVQDTRGPVALAAAREIQLAGNKVSSLLPLLKKVRGQCKDAKGNYRGDYAMFIDWALLYAQRNCEK
jgi:arylsulfatase A-like enzyme